MNLPVKIYDFLSQEFIENTCGSGFVIIIEVKKVYKKILKIGSVAFVVVALRLLQMGW